MKITASTRTPTELETSMYGENIEILSQEPNCTVYRITDAAEESLMTAYTVFPGIQLVYRDIHSPSCRIHRKTDNMILEITHCREGRLEYEADDSCCYLTPGDIAVMHRHNAEYSTFFPLSHYHGISVIMDLSQTPQCLSCFLSDVTVSPHTLADKFCSDRPFFVARSEAGVEHIFSELYHVPENLKYGYFKVKVLELMLFLTAFPLDTDETPQKSCSRSNMLLAKDVHRYLTCHLSKRITLEQLSSVFHVSGTTIKNSFKTVYGVSVYNFIRTKKMQMAAEALLQSEDTVLDIAGKFGYENASKFSGAFRDVMGMTPNEYRIAGGILFPHEKSPNGVDRSKKNAYNDRIRSKKFRKDTKYDLE